MLNKHDTRLISLLRQTGGKNIFDYLKHHGLKKSTSYEKIKNHSGLVKQVTTVLDYEKLGYEYRVLFIFHGVQCNSQLLSELPNNECVNYCAVSNKRDVVVEGLFKELQDIPRFKEHAFELLEYSSSTVIPLSQIVCEEHFLCGG